MNRIAGIIHFVVDGKSIETHGNWTVNPGRPKRDAVLGAGGTVVGYKEVLDAAPSFKGDMVLMPELDIDSFYKTDSMTITLTLGKKTYIIQSAWVSEAEISTEEGMMNVTFQGLAMHFDKAQE